MVAFIANEPHIYGAKKNISDLKEQDFSLSFKQKGVDMRIGLDIAGDSDFVPAAKLARREGIDFILDPMWATIKDNLFEHIDGLKSQWGAKDKKST